METRAIKSPEGSRKPTFPALARLQGGDLLRPPRGTYLRHDGQRDYDGISFSGSVNSRRGDLLLRLCFVCD
jgi:hypothetical protein